MPSEKSSELYGRRRDDVCPWNEPNPEAMKHIFGWRSKSQIVAHYLMISAGISVLILTFQMGRTLSRLETSINAVLVTMNQQLSELEKIHESIHVEGTMRRYEADLSKKENK